MSVGIIRNSDHHSTPATQSPKLATQRFSREGSTRDTSAVVPVIHLASKVAFVPPRSLSLMMTLISLSFMDLMDSSPPGKSASNAEVMDASKDEMQSESIAEISSGEGLGEASRRLESDDLIDEGRVETV